METAERASSDSVVERRVTALQEELRRRDLDALVCMKPQNSYFLSGFNPIFYSHPVLVIVPASGDPVMLVHALRDDHARDSSTLRTALYGAWSDKVTMGESWTAATAALLDQLGAPGRIGLDLDFIPTSTVAQLETTLGGGRFEDASDILERARMVKGAQEIGDIRRAAALTDVALEAAIDVVRARGTERDVAVAAMNAMHDAWADSDTDYEVADFGNLEGAVHSGLGAYCLAGDRVARNADNPTSRRIRDGELCMVFTFGCVNGMHAEQERCFMVGEVSDDARRVYDTFLRARERMFELMRPGLSCAELYRQTADVYQERGFTSYLPGRMGHGIGLGPHEHPSIGPKDGTVLQAGMVLTVEPNLRVPFLGGGGGQHSDTVVLTESGIEILTGFRRDGIRV